MRATAFPPTFPNVPSGAADFYRRIKILPCDSHVIIPPLRELARSLWLNPAFCDRANIESQTKVNIKSFYDNHARTAFQR
jgi:hypothetical protein